MKTICGIACGECSFKDSCKGCSETNGRPFGGKCVAAECYLSGGESCFIEYQSRLMDEFNSLKIADMPAITSLCKLSGAYVNLEYTLLNGEKIKLLDDKKVYLGIQVEKSNSDRCYGLVADDDYLLVCEYGCNGSDPEIILYKKRRNCGGGADRQ